MQLSCPRQPSGPSLGFPNLFQNLHKLRMLRDQPEFQALLLLHGRDRRIISAETELGGLPDAHKAIQDKIDLERDTIAATQTELRELETRSNFLGNEVATIESKIAQQKTKQLEVKRNEEYQALEKEIASLQEKMSIHEEEQLEILMKIDDSRETMTLAEGKHTERANSLERQLAELDEREKFLQDEIAGLKEEIKEACEEMDSGFLSGYERVKKVVRRPPYVVPVEDQKCSGCNLRVSNDVVSSILVEEKLTSCDQCGRIVYVER